MISEDLQMTTRQLDQKVTDKWEGGEYGRSEEHVAVVPDSSDRDLDSALSLKLISIRLPIELIESLKMIANHHQVAYQPMVRDLLTRFAKSEMNQIMRELDSERRLSGQDEESSKAVDEFIEREGRSAVS